MSKLTEKVVTEQEVPSAITDLVRFVQYLESKNLFFSRGYVESDLIKFAREFWDTQHGED